MGATVVPPAVPHTPGTWRLLYFDAPNRGEQVRQLFAVAKVPFVDVRLKFPSGLDPYKKAAMGDASPLLGTDLCPAVTAPDGTHCVETADVMRFVGQRVCLAPPDGSTEDAKAMEVTLLMQTAMNQVFYPLFKPMIVKHIFASEFGGALRLAARAMVGSESTFLPAPAAKLDEVLARLEAVLDASGGPYCCGAQLSYADVSVCAILTEVLAYQCFDRPALLRPRPKLAALLTDMEARTKPWMTYRVREHQLGITNSIEFFAKTNTPIPWSRKTKPEGKPDSLWTPPE
jgi:glutathione S-transferase